MSNLNKSILYHKPALAIIKRLSISTSGILIKSKAIPDDTKARFKKNTDHFEITFRADFFAEKFAKLKVGQTHKNVFFKTSDLEIVFENLYVRNHSSTTMTCEVDFFHSVGFSDRKQSYHRVIIPLKKSFNFRHYLEQKSYLSDLGYRSAIGTRALINGDELFIQIIHDDKEQYYFCIHSLVKQSLRTFSDKVFAVQCSFGYLTGLMPGSRGYYFSYSKMTMEIPEQYYVCKFRDTVDSGYTPVHTNPFALQSTSWKKANKIYKSDILQPVKIAEFSTLCQRTYDSTDFSSVLLLILESCLASQLFMPGGLAIALESLSDIIIGKEKRKFSPIKDKVLIDEIRKELNDLLDKFAAKVNEPNLNVLKKRIELINQPTNRARLQAPFEILEILLSDRDNQILESRNDFLHGRIPDILGAGLGRPLERKNLDLFYSSLRFYTLLNALILKWIGFAGYILNHPKIYENYCKVKLKEEMYRKL